MLQEQWFLVLSTLSRLTGSSFLKDEQLGHEQASQCCWVQKWRDSNPRGARIHQVGDNLSYPSQGDER